MHTPVPPRKAPKIRNFQNDELDEFRRKDVIEQFEDLTDKQAPPGYSFKRDESHVIYYKLEFDEVTSFPKVFGSIKVDRDLHVQLQCNGNPLPLPLWFVQGTNGKLKRFSQLENFPNEIATADSENEYSLIDDTSLRTDGTINPRVCFAAEVHFTRRVQTTAQKISVTIHFAYKQTSHRWRRRNEGR